MHPLVPNRVLDFWVSTTFYPMATFRELPSFDISLGRSICTTTDNERNGPDSIGQRELSEGSHAGHREMIYILPF